MKDALGVILFFRSADLRWPYTEQIFSGPEQWMALLPTSHQTHFYLTIKITLFMYSIKSHVLAVRIQHLLLQIIHLHCSKGTWKSQRLFLFSLTQRMAS